VLATHPGRIKERLIAAFNEAVLSMVSAAALPVATERPASSATRQRRGPFIARDAHAPVPHQSTRESALLRSASDTPPPPRRRADICSRDTDTRRGFHGPSRAGRQAPGSDDQNQTDAASHLSSEAMLSAELLVPSVPGHQPLHPDRLGSRSCTLPELVISSRLWTDAEPRVLAPCCRIGTSV